MSEAENNRELLRRVIEECHNQQKVDLLDEYFHPNFVDHAAQPGQQPGCEGYKQVLRGALESFPDLFVTIDELIAERDIVAFRGSMRGTNTGKLGPLPATGKSIEVSEIVFTRFEDGRAVERWSLRDEMGLARQLGLMP